MKQLREILASLGQMMAIIVFLIVFILQFTLLTQVGSLFNKIFPFGQTAIVILDLGVALHVINDRQNDETYKLTFLFAIIAMPIFGSLFYILSRWDIVRNYFSDRMEVAREGVYPEFKQDERYLEEVKSLDPLAYNTLHFLWEQERYPTYKNTKTEYYSSGEENFEAIKRELRRAKHFIFLEYFIIKKGFMWDEILEILKQKVDEGVEVRLLFDGTNMLTKVHLGFPNEVRKLGIKVSVFKPMAPVISLYQNHRDHRKIIVVDNQCAFTGGINISDEYINRVKPFGHWKDVGTLSWGPSTTSYTLMFLSMWNVSNNASEDPTPYLLEYEGDEDDEDAGYITPFGDDPYVRNRVGHDVINDIISQAKDYVYITTPYLILDQELKSDLIHAAQSGIDVRIITPKIPDKEVVFLVTRSYYKELLRGGVRIFEYSPGFIHAKAIVSDDIKSLVGTINLDYRSLFLHFECASYYYDKKLAAEVKEDFNRTFEVVDEFTLEDTKEFSYFERIMGRLLRVLAPLL